MKIGLRKDVGKEIWKSLDPGTRMLLVGYGLVTEPGEFGDLQAEMVAGLDRQVRSARKDGAS